MGSRPAPLIGSRTYEKGDPLLESGGGFPNLKNRAAEPVERLIMNSLGSGRRPCR